MSKRNEIIAKIAISIYLLFLFFIFFTQDYADGYVEYNNGQALNLEYFLVTVPVFIIALAINLVLTKWWNQSISIKVQNQESLIHQLPTLFHYLLRITINILIILMSVFFKDTIFKVQPLLFAPMFIIFNISLMIKAGFDYPKYKKDTFPFDDPKKMFKEYYELISHLSNQGKLEDFNFNSSLLSSFKYVNVYQEEYLNYALLKSLLSNNTKEFYELIDNVCIKNKNIDVNNQLIIELQKLRRLILGDLKAEEYHLQNSYFSNKNPIELSILINFYSSYEKDEYLKNFVKERNTIGWDPVTTSLRVYMEKYERDER